MGRRVDLLFEQASKKVGWVVISRTSDGQNATRAGAREAGGLGIAKRVTLSFAIALHLAGRASGIDAGGVEDQS